MINFTDLPVRKKSYGGANGNKISIDFDAIFRLIDDIECITNSHKEFLKLILKERFNALFY